MMSSYSPATMEDDVTCAIMDLLDNESKVIKTGVLFRVVCLLRKGSKSMAKWLSKLRKCVSYDLKVKFILMNRIFKMLNFGDFPLFSDPITLKRVKIQNILLSTGVVSY